MDAVVGRDEPAAELAVEVGHVGEAPAGQEAGLEVAVGPLDEALGLGVAPLAQDGADAERAPEGLELLGEDHVPAPPAADGRLLVPDHARGRAPNWRSTWRWPPSTSWAWRDGIIHAPMKRLKPATPTMTQPLGRLAVAEGDEGVGLPQVELGQLARPIERALAGIGRQEQRPQLGDAFSQHPDRVLPADALGHHRGRHRRGTRASSSRICGSTRVDDRALPGPLVARWRRRAQRRPAPCCGPRPTAGRWH